MLLLLDSSFHSSLGNEYASKAGHQKFLHLSLNFFPLIIDLLFGLTFSLASPVFSRIGILWHF